MRPPNQLYIGGRWVEPSGTERIAIADPATGTPAATVAVATDAEVAAAVMAARAAFSDFRSASVEDRAALLDRLTAAYDERADDLAGAVAAEIGLGRPFALDYQVETGRIHIEETAKALRARRFDHRVGQAAVRDRPLGVAGLITPWNWPLTQIVLKVAPAIAAGCAVVLKPSEFGPDQAQLFAEIVHEAGAPPGLVNLVTGGATVGSALVAHDGVDVISFTGSTATGIAVSKLAADTLKPVALELGGKSAAIVLDDADLGRAVADTVDLCFSNNGQSCDAPTRLLVPAEREAEALAVAAARCAELAVGDPAQGPVDIGPVINERQFDRVQRLIREGIDEGATLVAGGPGRPDGLDGGYFVRPTVFGDVTNDMAIAREEVFGPVLAVLAHHGEGHAIEVANDSDYGLAGYVVSADADRARRVAERLDVGQVHINFPDFEPSAPFGGHRRSGHGREAGVWGIDEFLHTTALLGYHKKG
ncbi:MAG: aldehyde dehydrogenase family protein [Actinomycetota bacterium]